MHGWQLDNSFLSNSTASGSFMAKQRARDGGDAADSDSDSDADDLPFACLICRKPFGNEPVVTLCGHYFDSTCAIKRYAKTGKCFACGAATNGVFNRCVPLSLSILLSLYLALSLSVSRSGYLTLLSVQRDQAHQQAEGARGAQRQGARGGRGRGSRCGRRRRHRDRGARRSGSVGRARCASAWRTGGRGERGRGGRRVRGRGGGASEEAAHHRDPVAGR